MCPYNAISMKLDETPISVSNLDLVKGRILPETIAVKVGKIELKDPTFTSNFYQKLLNRIEIKRAPPKST